MVRNLTTRDFITKANVVHDDKYGYDKVDYINAKTKVSIHCNRCDTDFEQTPNGHLCGRGCDTCASRLRGERRTKKARGLFAKRAFDIHGNKYGYDKVDYISATTKVLIHCNRCHTDFRQEPSVHVNASGGCRPCAMILSGERKVKEARESFADRAVAIHGNKYGYDKVDYINAITKVSIHCNRCHTDFKQEPNAHINMRCGCGPCAMRLMGDRKIKEKRESFTDRAIAKHGDRYRYDKVDYMGKDVKVSIHCNTCDTDFKQTPHSHLFGSGCSNCRWKTERMVFEFLRDNYTTVRDFTPEWCRNPETGRNLRCDICIEQLKIIFEIDGPQHFSNPTYFHKYMSYDEGHKRDMYKQNLAIENGYSVIRVVQEEILNNKYDWKEEILDQINNIKTPEICYISIDDMYTEW